MKSLGRGWFARGLKASEWPTTLLVAAVSFFSPGCKKKAPPPPPPPEVQIFTVHPQDVPIYHDWIGSLDGLVNAQIRAQVTGYLVKQNYREGESVKKGDELFEIDARPFQAALDQAKGQLAQTQAQLEKTELDVKRLTPLAATKAISQQEVDDAVQSNQAAKAAVTSATAAVEQASLNLGFTRILSPIDGIPSIARAQLGDLVGPASGELTTVSSLDPIKAYYNVSEQAYINFTRLFADEAVRNERARQLDLQLIFADGTVYPHTGHVFAVDREISPTTGALRVEALFPNPGNALRPGQFARVHVKFDTRKGALLVPQRAVTELQGSYQVVVVGDDNTAHVRPVKVGERSGSMWIIESGLKPGERVVVEGTQKAREGTRVVPKPFQGPEKSEASTPKV